MDDAFAVQIKLINGSPAGRRQPDEVKLVGVPGKVLMPVVHPRIEERSRSASGRIGRRSLVVFGAVTSLTGQGKVAFTVAASLTLRDDMFDRMQLSSTELGAEAV